MPSDPQPGVTAPAAPDTGPQRMHVLSLVILFIGAVRRFIVPLIAGTLVSGRAGLVVPVWLLLTAVATVLQWWRRTWTLDGAVLRVEEGVFARSQRVVPLARIQQVSIQRKLLHRLLGVATLRVETAGGSGNAEADLEVLTLRDAEWLRETLLAARGTTVAPAEAPPDRPLVRLGLGDVVLAGLTGTRGAAALAVVGPLFQYQEELDLFDRIQDLLERLPLVDLGPGVVAVALLGAVVLWFTLAAGSRVLTDYGFTMTIRRDDLVVRRGLLERREAVTPLARIQVVQVKESWLRRLLGMGSVQVHSAGAPGADVPILAAARFDEVLGTLLDGAAPRPRLTRHPPAARRRAVVRRAVPTLAAAVALAVAYRPWGALALLAVPLAVVIGLDAYRGLGNAQAGGYLYARRGSVVRSTAVVPTGKTQSLRVSSTPFQRRAGLATLHVDIAGGGGVPRVADESASAVARLFARLLRVP